MSATPLSARADTSFDVRHPAYVVMLFFVCFAFSYLDRQIVSILVQPIRTTLRHHRYAISLLQGFSFTMCYATAGVFVARLVDRANRVMLIAACVAIWAISTALCGFATSFPQLLAARAGTAIAEAALSPAALSIFSDIFALRKVWRARAACSCSGRISAAVSRCSAAECCSRRPAATRAHGLPRTASRRGRRCSCSSDYRDSCLRRSSRSP